MIAYVDSSALLRVVLRQPGRLAEWGQIDQGVTSAITEVECVRTLDRARLRGDVSSDDLAVRCAAVFELLDRLDTVDLDRAILRRASQPLSTPLGTLDALHLASALRWQEQLTERMTFATHDVGLGIAARAHGFHVIGLPA